MNMLTPDDVVLSDLRDGEKAYPIYRVKARWTQAIVNEKDLPPRFTDGLPPGRMWNCTDWDVMLKEECPPKALAAAKREQWWPAYVGAKNLPEPNDLTITVMLLGHDVWCPGWFSHWTFDVGMSDADVLDSFERYVERIVRSDLPESEKGSLMGAEDRWRWHGCTDGDPQGERTDAPCRCPACKASGLVRIDH